MIPEIRKAFFLVAGLGTRLLPATKASAKEMMPVVDKPLIQYAVEEAIAAGCNDLIFISGRGKGAIEDHFDIVSYELHHTGPEPEAMNGTCRDQHAVRYEKIRRSNSDCWALNSVFCGRAKMNVL